MEGFLEMCACRSTLGLEGKRVADAVGHLNKRHRNHRNRSSCKPLGSSQSMLWNRFQDRQSRLMMTDEYKCWQEGFRTVKRPSVVASTGNLALIWVWVNRIYLKNSSRETSCWTCFSEVHQLKVTFKACSSATACCHFLAWSQDSDPPLFI